MDLLENNIKKIGSCLKDEFKLKKVFLFGSQARGDSTDTSDYDLLLIIEQSSLSPLERMAKAQELLWNSDAPAADIFILTENEFENSMHDFGSIAESAVFEGRELSLDLFS